MPSGQHPTVAAGQAPIPVVARQGKGELHYFPGGRLFLWGRVARMRAREEAHRFTVDPLSPVVEVAGGLGKE